MKPKLRWLLLLIPLALFAWAWQAASWRPKLVGVQPTPPRGNGLKPIPLRIVVAHPLPLLVSPDGNYLLSQGNDSSENFFMLWDLEARRVAWQRKRDFNAWLTPLAFSPDGRTLAIDESFVPSNENQNRIILLDAATGQTRRSIGYVLIGNLQSAAFLSKRELVVSTDQGAKVVDVQTGKAIRQWKFELPVLPVTEEPRGDNQSHISTDGTTVIALANGSSDTAVAIYNAKTGKRRGVWSYKGVFRNPRLSPDGKLWALSWENANLSDVYDAQTGTKLWGSFAASNNGELWTWSADIQRIVTTPGNAMAFVNARTGASIRSVGGVLNYRAMALAPNDDYIYTLDDQGKIWRWRAR